MKPLIVKENMHGRQTQINAKTTYQTVSGEWVAEVDSTEIRRACHELYRGVKECVIEDLHIEAAQDDDGKEYRILSS